jgi:hypothetical protein
MAEKVNYSPVSKDSEEEQLVAAVHLPYSPTSVTVGDVKEYVEVCAPAAMMGGYELTVDVNGSYAVVLVVSSA